MLSKEKRGGDSVPVHEKSDNDKREPGGKKRNTAGRGKVYLI